LEDTAVKKTTFPSCSKMQIVDHALEIASPSLSKESESPSLHCDLERAEPIQGKSLDETAPLSLDCRSCSSGTVSLAHPQSHQHISHLKQEAPISAGSSPGWRLREDFKAELSPGSRRGTFRRKALNANDLPDALRIASLNAASRPGHNQKKTLDSKVKLTKDESVLARHSQDRKKQTKQSKLNGSGHTTRKELERQREEEAVKQRVLEQQAAKQQQKFAPHNRLGVAHHGAGTEVDEPPSCLVDKIPAEVSFHAKGFLGEADDDNDDDDQSVSSFASTLAPSVGSVDQQKELMQSSRWDMMDDSMMGFIHEARKTLSPNGKNAPLAGWQLQERIKSNVPALDTIPPDSKPAVPVRGSTDHTGETKCIAPKLPEDDGNNFLGFLNTAAVLSEPDCKPAAPIRQATDHDEGTKCLAPKLPDEGQDFLEFLRTKVQDEKKQLDVPPTPPMKRSPLIKAQASKLEAAVSKPSVSPPKRWVSPKKASGKGNDLPPAFSTMNASSDRLSSSMRSFAAVKVTSSSIPDCEPAVPIRQATNHDEGTKCVFPKLPDEGQDFLEFLQTKVQDEKKQLDVPPIPPMKRSPLIKTQASKLEAAVSKPSASPPKRSASRKKASGKGNDLHSAFCTMNELSGRLSSSMRSFGAIKAMSSSIPDCEPAVPIRESTRYEGEQCEPSDLSDGDQDVFLFLQKVVHEETKEQPPVSTPLTRGLSVQKEAEKLHSSIASFGPSSLDEGVINGEEKEQTPARVPASSPNEERKEQTPARVPASSPRKRWSPKKNSGKDLPPAFSTINESFERLHSSLRSCGAVKKGAIDSSTQDSKSPVPFLGFLQKVAKQEKKPDPPATGPSPMKNRKGMPAAFAAFDQTLRSISSSSTSRKGNEGNNKVYQEPAAAVPASPKKGWPPFKSFDLKRKSEHTVSTPASAEKSFLVSPASAGATSEKETASQALKHKVASRHGELLEERNKGLETSGRSGRSTPASPHSANYTRSPKVKCQRKVVVKPTTREFPVENSSTNGSSHSPVSMDKLNNMISRQLASDDTLSPDSVRRLCTLFSRQSSASDPSVKQSENNGSGHARGSKEKLTTKASKQASSRNEPLAQLLIENSSLSSSRTRGSKIKFQKKASKWSLKDEPPVDDSVNKNDSTHTARLRIKRKRVSSKKALSDAPSLDECANNGSTSHTVGSKIKLKRITKKSSSGEPSLDDSANNGSSHTAGSRIKLKRVSKRASKDEIFVEKSRYGRGSKGELSNFL
jgi:hypothetical protein